MRLEVDDHRRDIGGDEQRIVQMSARFSDIRFRHLLLPVWLLHYRWKGEVCQVVINGQSGTGKERVSPWARAVLDSGAQDFRPDKAIGKFTDISKKFHTYGILWTDKGFTWYLDGKAVHKLDRKEFVRPMSLTLTHRIEEQERPKLILKSLPDDIDIDWVKVWK